MDDHSKMKWLAPAARMTRFDGQRRILILSWLTYTLAYTLRVNIAVVIPALISERGYTLTEMGLVTSLYFITYMLGQLVNGYLGDRIGSKKLIVVGLIGSALCNLGVAFAPGLALTALCWAVNGMAQSMLWAPIMKTLSTWFARYQLERVSFIMSMSMIVGYAVSWGVSSVLVSNLQWQLAFYLPAGLVALFVLVLLYFFQGVPDPDRPGDGSVGVESAADTGVTGTTHAASPNAATTAVAVPAVAGKRPEDLSIREFFRLIQLPGLLVIALLQGLIREGISVWFPTILQDSGTLAATTPVLILIIIPLVNFAGILLVKRINKQVKGDSIRTLLIVFFMTASAALLLNIFLTELFWLVIPSMVVLLALTYGLTPVLTSVIPFQYAQYQRVALTAGVLDFAIYSGAALSGLASGAIADYFSWNGVMLLWLAAAVLGLILTTHRYIKNKGGQRHEQTINNQT